MADLVMAVFEEISLERNPRLWQGGRDNREENRKRINFLAEFSQTSFSEALNTSKSPARKNNMLAKALLAKSEKAANQEDRVRLLNQALCFSGDSEITDTVLRLRLAMLPGPGQCSRKEEGHRLTALRLLGSRTEEEETEILEEGGEGVEEREVVEATEIGDFPRHSTLKDFSSCVELRSEEGRGRFLVAGEDIPAGSVLAEDTSWAVMLDPAYTASHCDHCLAAVLHPVPCDTCATARFCSLKCRDSAMAAHHKHECLLQDVIAKSGTGTWPLALRIVSSRSLANWRSLALPDCPDETLGLEDAVYSCQDVLTVHSLVTHEGTARRPAPVLMKEALIALFLLRLLQKGGYFPSTSTSSSTSLTPPELETAMLLHHFMRVVYYNSHEAAALNTRAENWAPAPVVKIGVALNPSLALINHSCDGNYGRVQRGSKVTAFATRNIPKGSEILDTYSGTFFRSPKECRMEVHSRYNFTCACTACEENWPLEAKLPKNVSMRQVKKGTQENVAKGLDRDLKSVTRDRWVETTLAREALLILPTLLDCAGDLVEPPNYLLARAEELLHAALWKVHG